MLMFLPGFATPTRAYQALLEPLRAEGIDVVTPRWYGIDGYVGRYTAADEALDTWSLIRQLAQPTVVAGHSRGGQAAWRVSQLAADHDAGLPTAADAEGPLRAVALIDPVDGSGPRAHTDLATRTAARFNYPTLIIGAGIAGRCAPAHANHEAFAAAAPHAQHLVLPDLGHADILSGRARGLGRLLCGGGRDPDAARARVSDIVSAFYRTHAHSVGA